MGFPVDTDEGQRVEIVAKSQDEYGNELFEDADGTKWTRNLGDGGHDAHALTAYDADAARERHELLAGDEEPKDGSEDGISQSAVDSHTKDAAIQREAERTGQDPETLNAGSAPAEEGQTEGGDPEDPAA